MAHHAAMTFSPRGLRQLAFLAVATLIAAGCGTGVPDVDATPATTGTAAPNASSVPEPSAGLAGLGYLDNLLARTEAGDWELDEGIERSLRVLIGAAAQNEVLRVRPVASTDLTGLLATSREFLASGTGSDRADSIAGLLDLLVFDQAQLAAMTVDPSAPPPTGAPNPSPGGPVPTPGGTEVDDPNLESALPTFQTDCDRFFRRFPLGPGTERCLTARSANVGDLRYEVYAPAPTIATFGWTEDFHALLDQAVAETDAVYRELGTLPDFDVVLATNLDIPGEGATLVSDSRCQVIVYPDAQRRDIEGFKQVVARQLAHCFIAATFAEQAETPYPVRRWREDGLAEYLGNVVYPDTNLEWEVIEGLLPADQEGSMLEWSGGSAVWFQYLANEDDWTAVRELVERLPASRDMAEEARALAAVPGIDVRFLAFAQAYVDGTVEDTGGELIPTEWVPTVEEEDALIREPGALLEETLPPFSIRHRLLVVSPDGEATLGAGPMQGLALRARAETGDEWAELPETFPVGCTSDNRLIVLAVSAAPAELPLDMEVTDLAASGC
jgi:hypothetical protein